MLKHMKTVNIGERQSPTLKAKYQIRWYVVCVYIYTLWLFNIAMENGPFIDDKHDDLPNRNGDFPVRYVK